MRIRNARELATTPERKAALLLLDAALQACDTTRVMEESVALANHSLRIKDQEIDLRIYDRIYVVGGGKGACTMAAALEGVLGNRITGGIVIDTQPRRLRHIKCVKGTHPLPSAANQRGARAIAKLVAKAGAGALVLCIIMGGGSVLLADPHASITSAQRTVRRLLESGATIQEVNTVRKHLYALAGGNLSAKAYPARVVSLIVSDVVGNDPAYIASGPTTFDQTTVADARRILAKHKVAAAGLHDTPKERHKFNRTNNILLLTSQTAVDAMTRKATQMGLVPAVLDVNQTGEARDAALRLVRHAPQEAKHVLIAAGETTVTVKGKGKGGRNQELAAAAMVPLAQQQHCALASMGTDGTDHSDVAGAIVDDASLAAATKKKLDVALALKNNDTYAFFRKLGKHHIMTGQTGTNVADVMVVVRGPLKGVTLR